MALYLNEAKRQAEELYMMSSVASQISGFPDRNVHFDAQVIHFLTFTHCTSFSLFIEGSNDTREAAGKAGPHVLLPQEELLEIRLPLLVQRHGAGCEPT